MRPFRLTEFAKTSSRKSFNVGVLYRFEEVRGHAPVQHELDLLLAEPINISSKHRAHLTEYRSTLADVMQRLAEPSKVVC